MKPLLSPPHLTAREMGRHRVTIIGTEKWRAIMKFDSQQHQRHSIRLKEYDYAQPNGYFVTIVTYHRDCLFGEVIKEEMRLNQFGHIVDECWRAISKHFPNVELVHMW
jgi:hypothetical protein